MMKNWERKLLGIVLCAAMVIWLVTGIVPEAKAGEYIDNEIKYTYNDTDHTATVNGYTSKFDKDDVYMPEKITVNGNNYTVNSIGEGAFANCNCLKEISIPNSVTSIGGNAFSACTMLNSISFGNTPQLSSIGNYAFYSCDEIASITIPASVTTIGNKAFGSCKELTEITVNSGNNSYSSDDGVLFDKNKTKLICYPKGKLGKTYMIPATVTSIGESAFYLCNNLESVSFESASNLSIIGKNAFESCLNLKTITIPDSVTSIGERAFSACLSLYSITFSTNSQLSSIGDFAFNSCDIMSITIPANVATIGKNPFYDCNRLTSITVDNDNFTLVDGILFDKNITKLICYPGGKKDTTYTIPDTAMSIEDYAFYNCSSLKNVSLGSASKLSSIGDSAFYHTGLTGITIPDSVTSIGDKAFYKCESLASVTFGSASKLSSIEEQAFNFTCLTGITIPNSVTSIGFNAFPANMTTLISLPSTPPTLGKNVFDNISSAAQIFVHGSAYETASGWSGFKDKMTIISTVTLNDRITATGNPFRTENGVNYYTEGTTLTLSDSDSGYCAIDNVTKKNITNKVIYGNALTVPAGDVTVAKDISYTITFEVENGGWDEDGSTGDKTFTVSRHDNEDLLLVLKKENFPAVGNKPNREYTAGSWYPVPPDDAKAVSGPETYKYTYQKLPSATITADPQGKTLTYTGKEQELITAGSADGGTMYYAVVTDSDTAPTSGWAQEIPTRKEPGQYYIWSQAVGDTTHSDSDIKYSCMTEIGKAPLTVTAKPKTIYYGDEPKDDGVTYTGFVNGETETTAGLIGTLSIGYSYRQFDDAGDYIITPSGLSAGNYEITFISGTLTVKPKSIIGAEVTLDNNELTYNGSEQTVNVTGVTIDGLSLTSSDYDVSGNKGINVGEYDLTVTGKGNYEGEATTKWTITGKKISVTTEGFAGEYDGQPHGIKVTVTDPASGAVVKYGKEAGTYDLDESPTITDAGTMTVYFKVSAENYADHTGSATVTIAKAGAAVVTTVPTAKDLTYTGNAQELVTAGAASGGTVQYALGADALTIPADGWSETVPVGTLPGPYYVWYKVVGDVDHDDGDAACVTAEIKKGTITATAAGYTGAYDGQAHGITVTVTVPAEGAVVKYGSVEGSYDLDASPTMTDAGTLTVYFRVTAENYADNTGSATVTIGKTDAAVVTAPTAKVLTYTGAAQELVAAGAASGGTMQYALGADTTTAPAEGWGVAVPGGTDPGTYYVWYKVVGDADHNDTAAACVTAAIKKADAVVTVAPTAVNGLVATGAPQALVTAGTASGGEMQYALGADAVTAPTAGWSTAIPVGTDAGAYFVWYKAVGDANHNDSAAGCVTVTIGVKEQINISKAKVGKVKNQTYTGKKIKPELQVILGDTVLVQGVDYDVKVDNKKIGYATARAVGKGDYTGKTKKVTFKIVPKPVKDKKIKVEKKGKDIEVSWKKNGKKLDGYEIQVSTNENFKKDTNRWIGIYDTKKTKFLVTSLEVGKTYYFRVRCYKYVKNGKDTEKFNSEWSVTAMIELK